jgi:NADH-quinone oxidoreductase subunit J
MEGFLFWFCGGLMFLGGVMMVVQRNAVVSAVWLIFSFICASGIFALLNAPFLAVMQVLVYAGAIMVLFLFVIMMLQGAEMPTGTKRLALPLWPLAALPGAAVVVMVVGYLRAHGAAGLGPAPAAGFGSPAQVAGLLLGRYVLAFEVISITLLVAMVGALAIGKDDRKLPWK